MKKTIIILSTLASLVGSAMASTIFTTDNSVSTTASNYYYSGFRLNLDPTLENSRLTTTGTNGASLPGLVNLDSISLTNVRTMQGNANVYLTLVTSTGITISQSTNSITSAGAATFNFSDTHISTTENLYFVFTNKELAEGENATTAGVDGGTTLVMAGAGSNGLINYGNQSGTNSLTMIGNNNNNNMNIYNSNMGVNLEIKTSPIPEPAVSMLGLIGLGSMLIRRRRNA